MFRLKGKTIYFGDLPIAVIEDDGSAYKDKPPLTRLRPLGTLRIGSTEQTAFDLVIALDNTTPLLRVIAQINEEFARLQKEKGE